MPVTFTAVGSTLDVTIIDANFFSFEQLFKSGVVTADFLSTFSRFRVRRYVSGTLVAAHSFANPYRAYSDSLSNGIIERLDISFRKNDLDPGVPENIDQDEQEIGRHAYEMELLGKPGPSFYYSFQEDAYDPAVVLAGVAGWPPAGWPIGRYPSEFCFSRWLTCPGASVRVYVPYPCVARVHSMAKGDSNMYSIVRENVAGSSPIYIYPHRRASMRSHAIIVDTNPTLYMDEFSNTNPNVKDPTTGLTSPYCSWKILDEITRFVSNREVTEQWAEVALKGGRYYNFSMKWKDPCTHGWVDKSTNTFMHSIWERSVGAANSPVLGALGSLTIERWYSPKWIALWENCSINVEFFYGRSTAYVNDTSHADFSTKAL